MYCCFRFRNDLCNKTLLGARSGRRRSTVPFTTVALDSTHLQDCHQICVGKLLRTLLQTRASLLRILQLSGNAGSLFAELFLLCSEPVDGWQDILDGWLSVLDVGGAIADGGKGGASLLSRSARGNRALFAFGRKGLLESVLDSEVVFG